MALNPFRGFWDMQSQMNQMFEDIFAGRTRRPQSGQGARQQVSEWGPAMDVLQKNGDLLIRAELPGMKQEDVNISLQDNVLTISGERKAEEEEQRSGYYVRERRYGAFSRSMLLPEGIDESKIRARFENGVLEVTVEGAGAVREPKRIQIEGASGSESPGS